MTRRAWSPPRQHQTPVAVLTLRSMSPVSCYLKLQVIHSAHTQSSITAVEKFTASLLHAQLLNVVLADRGNKREREREREGVDR